MAKNSKSLIREFRRLLRHMYSYISRRKKDVWVFGSWQGKLYADNPRYMMEYMSKEHPEIQVAWIARDKKVVESVRSLGYRAELAKSRKGRSLCMHAAAVFMTEGHLDVSDECIGGALKIQLWHAGMGPKALQWISLPPHKETLFCIEPYDHSQEYWMMPCDAAADLHSRAFAVDRDRFYITGACRLDNLVKKPVNPMFEKLKEERAGRKFVIYTPTHRNFGADTQNFISKEDFLYIDNRLEEMNVTMIFKPHFHELEVYAGYDMELKNIILATDSVMYGNVYDYLHYMDAMIADYSSLSYDYSCLDRPEIFYVYDIEWYKKSDAGLIPDFEEIVPGPVCKTWDSTLDALEEELNHDHFAEKRRAFCKLYNPLNDGNSCQRVYEKVMELLEKR